LYIESVSRSTGYVPVVLPKGLRDEGESTFPVCFPTSNVVASVCVQCQQRIENPVAKLILQGKFGPKDVIPVDVDEAGEFRFGRTVH